MHRLLAALLAAASCATMAQAQTSPPIEAGQTLSLDRALELAGATSPTLDAAEADIQAAAAARTPQPISREQAPIRWAGSSAR